MKNYSKILFSILVAMMCTVSFAADKPAGCKKSGKNCPMKRQQGMQLREGVRLQGSKPTEVSLAFHKIDNRLALQK